jgi:hypothetical protein
MEVGKNIFITYAKLFIIGKKLGVQIINQKSVPVKWFGRDEIYLKLRMQNDWAMYSPRHDLFI